MRMRRMCVLISAVVMAGCAAAHPAPAPPPPSPPERTSGAVQVSVDKAGGATLGEIHFSDPRHGWARGPELSLVTADGGETWAPATAPVVEPGRQPQTLPQPGASWCAVTPEILLAVADVAVLRSADQGKSWQPILQSPLEGGQTGGALRCRGGGAWVLLTGGVGMSHQAYVVYRSTDGGSHFEPMLVSGMGVPALEALGKRSIDAYSGPFDVIDADTAFFLGHCSPCANTGTASITRTADGGQTWQQDVIPLVQEATAISFTDARRGWIVTTGIAGSRILATADGGKTWQVQYPAAALTPARAVTMLTETAGYGMGLPGDAGALLATRDGGKTWQKVGRLDGWAAGAQTVQRGLILTFPAATEGWAISPDGRLLHSTDSGHQWQERKPPAGLPALTAVSFATTTAGCVAQSGFDGAHRMFGSTDGGNSWQAADSGGGVVACAWRLAGQDWVGTAPPGAKGAWTVLDARSSGIVWGTTDAGELWATRDRGKTWQQYSWPAGWRLAPQSLSHPGAAQGWAVTEGGQFLRTVGDDGHWASP